jgi:hypothetical protein
MFQEVSMRFSLIRTAIVVALVVCGSQIATAHHSTAGVFDLSRSITLEGNITRLEWVSPHILLFLESKNSKGESETWVLQGFGPGGSPSVVTKARLLPGTTVTVRAYPSRSGLVVSDNLRVSPSGAGKPGAPLIEAGQIRFSNGDILNFGKGPAFDSGR